MDLMWMESYCLDGDYIWMVVPFDNTLIKVSMKTKACIGEFKIPEHKHRLFSSILKVEGYLLLIPAEADNMWIFDLESGEFQVIQMAYKMSENGEKLPLHFWFHYIRGNVIYLMSEYRLAAYDIKKREVNFFPDMVKRFPNYVQSGPYTECEDGFMIPFGEEGKIFRFNCKTQTGDVINFAVALGRFKLSVYDGGYYWLISCHDNVNTITKICPADKTKSVINLQETDNDVPFCRSYIGGMVIGEYVVFLPSLVEGGRVVCIHRDTQRITVNLPGDSRDEEYRFSGVKRTKDGWTAYENLRGRLYIFHEASLDEIQMVPVWEHDVYAYYKFQTSGNGIIHEDKFGLKIFLDVVGKIPKKLK